ncbi:MAG TPA: DUF4831 family protein [Bacteroidales bacterium]|nr:DUF4831 family protein [Bacteroidales bacterium]
MKRILLTGMLLSISLFTFAQLLTERLSTATDTARGVVYQLPKVLLQIQVETKCIVETPGLYFQYADRFLGLKDVIQNESIHYEITGFSLTTKTIADTSQAFLISTGKKGKNIDLELTPEGFLKSINGKRLGKEVRTSVITKNSAQNEPKAWETTGSSIFTKEMQQANSTAKMAELAANQLFTIRDTRFSMLTQDADKTPADGRSYEIVLSELNRMESAYLELFKGKMTESSQTHSFTLDPQKDSTDVLLRFSLLKGILGKNNLGGDPLFVEIKNLPIAAQALRVDKTNSPRGLYYRVPGKAVIQITDGKDVLFTKEVVVPQFGRVLSLPATQITAAELCPVTGALLEIRK